MTLEAMKLKCSPKYPTITKNPHLTLDFLFIFHLQPKPEVYHQLQTFLFVFMERLWLRTHISVPISRFQIQSRSVRVRTWASASQGSYLSQSTDVPWPAGGTPASGVTGALRSEDRQRIKVKVGWGELAYLKLQEPVFKSVPGTAALVEELGHLRTDKKGF